MRPEIVEIILSHLQKHGEQSTAELQAAVQASGLERSQHRHSVLRNSILEKLAEEGRIEFMGEGDDKGGGRWAIPTNGGAVRANGR